MRKSSIVHDSKGDIRKIVRDELNKAKNAWIGEFIDRVNDNFTEKISKFKNEIITILDKVVGELKTIRVEFTVMSHKLLEHSDSLENHESRIVKLEQPLPAT